MEALIVQIGMAPLHMVVVLFVVLQVLVILLEIEQMT